MRSCERVFCALAVFAAMTILLVGLFGASEALGAGGMLSTELSESIDLPGFGWLYATSGNRDLNQAWASVYMDPDDKCRVRNGSWNFGVSSSDPALWNASFSMYGYLVAESGQPFSGTRTQNLYLRRGDMEVSNSTSLVHYVYECEGKETDYNYVSASFDLKPAKIENSTLSYYEFDDDDPLTKWWSVNYNLSGRFAGTPEEALAIGQAFLGVPEPSTLVLLVSLGIAGIALSIWRRRK